ncbi:hypothetical protein F5Y12DRAFT_778921 [Xylaria sp. FL1777]|nr:hypothetical protein F5Y12DRAFT_778921 [Xylaria sp. FL1777]
MVSSRKRALGDTEPDEVAPQPPSESDLLQRIRSLWQFANLFQWIYLFGRVVKIDESIDIDDLEAECLKPQSTVLVDIGLALLRFVSSHRGLTHDLFDEYTRRQYVAKAPDRNPFGTGEPPARFNDFDALLKIRVLQQLTQWVMLHPERIREKMDEQKPSDQTDWRIEPTGWDSEDRTYYILDDNRLYRLTPAPPPTPAWKPKKNTKKAKAAARASKRRRTSRSVAQSRDAVDDDPTSDVEEVREPEDDGLGGAKWECIGVSLSDIQNFLATLRKTRDDNEKILRSTIEEHLLPILEKQEESRKRKALQREKELLNLEKMAHAKRSSRIASKAEQQKLQQKLQQQAREEEEKRQREEKAARKEGQLRLKLEREHDKRARSREERLKERQNRRLQHEDELAQLSEENKSLGGDNRMSERRLKAEIAKSKRVLQDLEDEADDWIFDCVCGIYGQVDDGTHSVACERCNIWQHSKCVGISEDEADRDDFHFLCKSCRRHPDDTKQPMIKLRIARPDTSSTTRRDSTESPVQPQPVLAKPSNSVVQSTITTLNRPDIPHPVHEIQAVDRSQLPPVPQPSGFPSIPVKSARPNHVLPPVSPYTNGDGIHAFSSPHPALSPPEQSPTKSRAYSTLFNSSSPETEARSASGQVKLPQTGMFYPPTKRSSQGSPSHVPPAASTSVPSIPARSDSPLKKPLDTTNNYLIVSSPPSITPIASSMVIQTPNTVTQGQRAVLSTPQLDKSVFGAADTTPSLPPSRNGISPMKRSPPPQRRGSRIHSSPAPAILPPATTLSPSPSQQILTPPIKPADPVRPG